MVYLSSLIDLDRVGTPATLVDARRPQGAPRKAEFCFQQALDIARGQSAKSWELRAATSLARLYRDQGRHERAHELLACVYEWFTEGFETPDLQEAKGLLEELTAA